MQKHTICHHLVQYSESEYNSVGMRSIPIAEDITIRLHLKRTAVYGITGVRGEPAVGIRDIPIAAVVDVTIRVHEVGVASAIGERRAKPPVIWLAVM